MRDISLQRRFVLGLLPVIVGGPLVVGLAGQLSLRENQAEQRELRLRAHHDSVVLPLASRLRSLVRGVETFAGRTRSETVSGAPPGMRLAARELRDAHLLLDQWPEIEEVFAVRPAEEGILFARVRRRWARTERLSVLEAPSWARPHTVQALGGTTGLRVAADHGPARLWWKQIEPGPDGWRLGVLVDPARLQPHVESAVRDSGGWLGLLRPDGRVYQAFSSVSRDHASVPARLHGRKWSDSSGPSTLDLDDCSWSVARTDDRRVGWSAVFAMPEEELQAGVGAVPWVLLGVLLLSTTLSFLFIHRLVGRVTRPLLHLRSEMERVARGDLTPRLPVEGTQEMASLSRSFNAMVSDLHTSHEALRAQSVQLGEALRRSESVDRMKDDFLALVSHEVRTPLTSILGSVEFLREEFSEKHSQTEVEFMGILRDSAQRLSGFMNDAILMASLQSKGSEQDFDEFSVSAMVDVELEKIAARIDELGLEVSNGTREANELFLRGDWTLFQVAVQKLVDNTWRHNRDGGRLEVDVVSRILEDEEDDLVHVCADVASSPREDAEWLALRFFNSGECVDEKSLRTLFERFELVHDIDHHQRGSGLSLPIVFSIVDYHGGRVEARAVEDEGMAFYLVLPVRQGSSPRRAQTAGFDDDVDETVRMAREVAGLSD